jgi:hypothetical protein
MKEGRKWWWETFTDPDYGILSHIRQINYIGAVTASVLMFCLFFTNKLTEGYFGIYCAAVGLTAVGYKMASKENVKSTKPTGKSRPPE